MYGILHYISTHKLSISAGWIHLPHLPCVATLPEAPSMSLETSIKGVKIAISAALNNKHDTSEPILSRLQI
ncbi:hypothetical protein fh0823_07000 [Francisella halioticida]|nr:hypothetical protein fh0823_07000 [Francisella halioticida]